MAGSPRRFAEVGSLGKMLKFSKVLGLEGFVFGLTLLFLPVNLSKHFFFDFAYVGGILVDYLLPTVYLSDILVWALLGLWLFRILKGFPLHFNRLFAFSLGLVLVSGLSVSLAINQPAAVYKWLKLLEYILFSFYVSRHVDLKSDFLAIVKLLSIGLLFESVLATLQWFKQSSIFGYYFLGENRYTAATSGIATFDLNGVKKVRPYGTFPHPNVLGGYLAVLMPWVFYESIKGVKGVKERGFYFLTTVFGIIALFFSFSRAAWVVGGLGILGVLWVGRGPGTLSFPFYSSFFILNSLSFTRRAELNWIALEIVKDHPFLGVGLNNFTVKMDEYGRVSGWTRFLQPVHNLYLLVANEIGLLGLTVFLALLLSSFHVLISKPKPSGRLFLISLLQVFLLGFFDHYFWTIQQTSLLFWLILGLVGV